MAKVHTGRHAAVMNSDDDEMVVFLIGMRINHLWQVWRWMPVAMAMPRMIAELSKDRSLGLRGRPRTFVSGRVVSVLQYWESFEHLESYARNQTLQHLPAWKTFNKRINANGSVGIYHETYRVPAKSFEAIYVNMPDFGLGEAASLVPVGKGRQTAADRIGKREDGDAPVAPY